MSTWRELSFPDGTYRLPLLEIDDDRVSIVTDPLRWRILETLGGGKSLAEVSANLGVTDARVLYHLLRLVKADVVVARNDTDDPRARRFLPAAAKIRVLEPEKRNSRVPETIPPEIVDDFNQARREAEEGMFGAAIQISVNHNRARLSDAQAAEFSRRLLQLIEEYFPPGKGDRNGLKYGFYGVLTPIDLHPLEDELGE